MNRLGLCMLVLVSTTLAKEVPIQRAYMRWGRECLGEMTAGRDTYLEAPMKDDGSGPDMKQARMVNLIVNYTDKCGQIEIRREKVK